MLGPDVRDVLEPKFAALLDYALRVTKAPMTCEEAHVNGLRDAGATDDEIHATVQVAALPRGALIEVDAVLVTG